MLILPRDVSNNVKGLTVWAIFSMVLDALPFFVFGSLKENYTGILNQHPLALCCCLLPVLAYMCTAFYMAYSAHYPKTAARTEVLWMLGITAALMITPYHAQEDFWSGLHVLLGLAAFLNLNRLLFKLFVFHPKAFRIYCAGTVPAFLLALSALSISGPSELVYSETICLALLSANLQ
ncbi:MAG: hypothetical protein IKE28_03705 [Solobacterium sp.]|nr:hypothetical protein [Solobacterium sp.]